jgi:prepilin-type N-terminal cleavage/methylation domain-containing protein
MKLRGIIKRDGFTLLEVVVSIVITAALVALLVTLMGTPLAQSADPLLSLRNAYNLQKVMESLAARTNSLAVLKVAIGTEGSRQENTFGTYQVVNNRFITFGSGGTEASGGTNTLKVTIRNDSGDRLTRLFCK